MLKDEKSSSSNKQAKPDQLSKTEPNAELYKYPKYLKKSIGRDQIDFLNKESPKTHLKNKYKSHDYEIYLQNAMPSQQCGRDIEKVKIYNLEKDINKKIRNVLNSIHFEKEPEDTDVETPKFCERYWFKYCFQNLELITNLRYFHVGKYRKTNNRCSLFTRRIVNMWKYKQNEEKKGRYNVIVCLFILFTLVIKNYIM